MYLKRVLLITAFVGIGLVRVSAQTTTTEHLNQVWLAYFNQTRFSNKWGAWADLQLRTKKNFTDSLSQALIRLGITYYLNEQTRITAGYAFFNHYPADNHQGISQPENRLWQQVMWNNKYPKLQMRQWLRLEERFRHNIADNNNLAAGYSFNWRLRYSFSIGFPLSKNAFAPHTFSAVVNDELHINFGKKVVYNYFDQNRFFAGFAYHMNAQDNLQFGYLNVFFQLASGNKYKNVQALRIAYLHNLDLRKK